MFTKLKNRLMALHKDDGGAMSVEMILILVGVGIPILILLFIFAKKIIAWFQTKDADLTNQYN
jgi:hypothetical protein